MSAGTLQTSTSCEKDCQGASWEWDCQSCVKAYPMQAIAAVNEVLFEQHGYQGLPAKEDPRSILLLISLSFSSLFSSLQQDG